MSEKSSENRPFRMPIMHAEAIRYPELRDEYTSERMTAIGAGKPVWMLEGLDQIEPSPDPLVRINFYFGGLALGYVHGNEQEGWQCYGPPLEEEENPQHLNIEPIDTIGEAQRSLVDYLHDTGQIRR
jgi:hypothetical protein